MPLVVAILVCWTIMCANARNHPLTLWIHSSGSDVIPDMSWISINQTFDWLTVKFSGERESGRWGNRCGGFWVSSWRGDEARGGLDGPLHRGGTVHKEVAEVAGAAIGVQIKSLLLWLVKSHNLVFSEEPIVTAASKNKVTNFFGVFLIKDSKAKTEK